MELLLDADGLIKLNRAGVLTRVVETCSCVVPLAVYGEAVTEGKARRYPDADAIEEALSNGVQIEDVQGSLELELGLGPGEQAILTLLSQRRDAIVVSDDRRFLTVLSRQEIPFLTPVDVLVVLKRRRVLTALEAREALERLRPAIRTTAYWDAREDLQSEGGGHGKD